MKSAPSNALVWFAVLGGGVAWIIQFAANAFVTFAQCDQPIQRWMLPMRGVEIGLSVVAAAFALAAGGASLRLFLATYRDQDAAALERQGMGVHPPLGRVSFLSMIGLTVNLLVLVTTFMTGVGAPLLPICRQA